MFERLREPFNALSHGVGAVLSVVGFVSLLYLARAPLHILAATIYGLSLILLYTFSCLYHGLKVPGSVIQLLGKLDRVSIYVLIAGSVTPFALIVLPGFWGWSLLAIVWTGALIGGIYFLVAPTPSRGFSTLMFLGVGWVGIFYLNPLVDHLPRAGLAWLLVGGLLYTVGAIVYWLDWPRFSHELWHLLALGGSGAHFISIAGYTL